MEGGKRMLSKGKVQTIINGKMVQDKEYGLKYDGNDMAFAIDIEILKLENLPGPRFTKILSTSFIFISFFLKKIKRRFTNISKFSLLFI